MKAKTDRPIEDRPVDLAIETEACGQCGAVVGVPCKVDFNGRLHDGAHRDRLEAVYRRHS